jgi:hypothetical protein
MDEIAVKEKELIEEYLVLSSTSMQMVKWLEERGMLDLMRDQDSSPDPRIQAIINDLRK